MVDVNLHAYWEESKELLQLVEMVGAAKSDKQMAKVFEELSRIYNTDDPDEIGEIIESLAVEQITIATKYFGTKHNDLIVNLSKKYDSKELKKLLKIIDPNKPKKSVKFIRECASIHKNIFE